MDGFGWNFYGFFLFCIVWIGAYFVWARRIANRAPTTHEAPGTPQARGTHEARGTRPEAR